MSFYVTHESIYKMNTSIHHICTKIKTVKNNYLRPDLYFTCPKIPPISASDYKLYVTVIKVSNRLLKRVLKLKQIRPFWRLYKQYKSSMNLTR